MPERRKERRGSTGREEVGEGKGRRGWQILA